MLRLLQLVAAILAIACFFSSGYAIYWIWSIKKPVMETTTNGFDRAQQWLGIADHTIDDAKRNLQVSRESMLKVEQMSPTVNQPNFVDRMYASVASSAIISMAPGVVNAQQTLEKVTEASMVVNSILDSVPDEALESVDRLDTKQVKSLQSQIADVTKASWNLGNLLAGAPGENESPAIKAARIAASLDSIIATTEDFQKRVEALSKRIERIRQTTNFWMKYGPPLASAVLVWIMISQLVVLRAVVRAVQRRDEAKA